MTRKDLRQRVERLLQDSDNKRWSDSEINGYLDDAQLDFCRIAKNPKRSVTSNLVDTTKRFTDASLSVSSKTVTVTLDGSDTHTLSIDSSVLITGSSNDSRNGGHVIISATSGQSTFQYLLDTAESGSETGITVLQTGPTISKPSTILEITSISIDGRELAVYTESDLNNASNRYSSTTMYLSMNMSKALPFFSNNTYTASQWRKSEGLIEGAVFDERSASSFRVFPLPSDEEHVFIDKDSSSKVSKQLVIHGVTRPASLSADTSTPEIPESYQESLVYGALDRAYLKETNLRNVDKAQAYRARFFEYATEALRNEGLNSSTIGFGRNQASMRVWR
jgi:hypothetical protein